MDWANEEYVKVYRRDTADDLLMSWQALAVWRALLLKFDRSGILNTKQGARGVAAVIRIPLDVVGPALEELLSDGRLQQTPAGYFAPNFMAAQETGKGDRVRQRESRQRRANEARAHQSNPGIVIDQTFCHDSSRAVTDGHDLSQNVTLSYANPKPNPEPKPELAAASGKVLVFDPSATSVPGYNQRLGIWTYMLDAIARVRSHGIDPNGTTLRNLAPGGPIDSDMVKTMKVLAASGCEPDEVVAKMRHIVDVREAEAIRDSTMKWFNPSSIWKQDAAMRSVNTSLEEATKEAAPARSAGRPPDPPPRRINRLDQPRGQ